MGNSRSFRSCLFHVSRPDLLVDRVLIPALTLKIFVSAIVRHEAPLSTAVGIIGNFVLPVLVLALLILARPASHSKLNMKATLGLLLSFSGFWFFRWSGPIPSRVITTIGIANTIFYTSLVAYSYVSIGRSFGVAPAVRPVVSTGPYRLVRHPVYACFLHLALNVALLAPTMRNVTSALAIALGLHLRIQEEENIFATVAEYGLYCKTTPRKLLSLWISAPVLVLAVTMLAMSAPRWCGKGGGTIASGEPLTVQVAFPITAISPLIYDDWSSVFLGNHIYRRLFSEVERPAIPAITDQVRVGCAEAQDEKNLDRCRNVEVRFVVKSFQDCNGRTFDAAIARKEFENILRKKTWILPGWRTCAPSVAAELCYTAPHVADVKRRLRNLYFRFGWSLNQNSDATIGSGPYCLTRIERDNTGIIQKGFLSPHRDSAAIPLSPISLITSEKADTHFNIALYGTKALASGRRLNVQTHTPLAYYVVTNEAWSKYRLPWNTPDARQLIAQHMTDLDMLYPRLTKLHDTLPAGAAIDRTTGNPVYRGKQKLELMLPDYLPNCPVLANALTKQWEQHHENARAICGNTSLLIENFTKRGFKNWFGIMSPLSPGAPGRNATQYQYFSPYSKESWTGSSHNTEALYYMVGIGQSLATIDSEIICGLQPNSMGLGDVFVTDFIKCDLLQNFL